MNGENEINEYLHWNRGEMGEEINAIIVSFHLLALCTENYGNDEAEGENFSKKLHINSKAINFRFSNKLIAFLSLPEMFSSLSPSPFVDVFRDDMN